MLSSFSKLLKIIKNKKKRKERERETNRIKSNLKKPEKKEEISLRYDGINFECVTIVCEKDSLYVVCVRV